MTEIAIPIYEGFTPLDAIGPYEVLARLPEVEVRFVAARPGPVGVDANSLKLVAEASLDKAPPEVVELVRARAAARPG
jgi:putative intracellular protease/amidase